MPETRLNLQYDKLYVDNAVFVVSEDTGEVVEMVEMMEMMEEEEDEQVGQIELYKILSDKYSKDKAFNVRFRNNNIYLNTGGNTNK